MNQGLLGKHCIVGKTLRDVENAKKKLLLNQQRQPWRTPKLLVRLKMSLCMLNIGIVWSLGTLPALNIRRGRGACWGSGIRLGRGPSYSLIRTCIKLTKLLFVLGFPSGSLETVPVWTPGTLAARNFLLRPLIGMRFEANL